MICSPGKAWGGCCDAPGCFIDGCEAWRLHLDNKFDGDQESAWCVMTDEAIAEINRILDSRDYYLTLDGAMAFSQDTDNINLALKYLTKRD